MIFFGIERWPIVTSSEGSLRIIFRMIYIERYHFHPALEEIRVKRICKNVHGLDLGHAVLRNGLILASSPYQDQKSKDGFASVVNYLQAE